LENVFGKNGNKFSFSSSFRPAGLSPRASPLAFPSSRSWAGPARAKPPRRSQHRQQPLPRRPSLSTATDKSGPCISAVLFLPQPTVPVMPQGSNCRPTIALLATWARRPAPRPRFKGVEPPRAPLLPIPALISHSHEPWTPKTAAPRIAGIRRPPSRGPPSLSRRRPRFSPR